mgnify:CR=1 FL=1
MAKVSYKKTAATKTRKKAKPALPKRNARATANKKRSR